MTNPQLEALEALIGTNSKEALQVLHALLSEGSPRSVGDTWERLPIEAQRRLYLLGELLRYTDWQWVEHLLEGVLEEEGGLEAWEEGEG